MPDSGIEGKGATGPANPGGDTVATSLPTTNVGLCLLLALPDGATAPERLGIWCAPETLVRGLQVPVRVHGAHVLIQRV